jgi:hypothetical protein
MKWIYLVLVCAAALLAVVRIFAAVRKARLHSREDDWDAHQVKTLRDQGATPFNLYEVDFFFNLPDDAAGVNLRTGLEPEGFTIDTRPMGGEGVSGYSVHASRAMRLNVEDMQGLSRRFRQLAQQLGGHYDGWTTDPSRRVGS